jgi:hypothetical protein
MVSKVVSPQYFLEHDVPAASHHQRARVARRRIGHCRLDGLRIQARFAPAARAAGTAPAQLHEHRLLALRRPK